MVVLGVEVVGVGRSDGPHPLRSEGLPTVERPRLLLPPGEEFKRVRPREVGSETEGSLEGVRETVVHSSETFSSTRVPETGDTARLRRYLHRYTRTFYPSLGLPPLYPPESSSYLAEQRPPTSSLPSYGVPPDSRSGGIGKVGGEDLDSSGSVVSVTGVVERPVDGSED